MEKFGIIFGRLVRLRRGGAGLSQDELADKADTTKARISDLESGKVANPQAATVNKLCSALNISPEDRFSCYEEGQSANPLGLPTAVLTKLARHFGSDVPDGTEQELVAFLVAKAEEFRELNRRSDPPRDRVPARRSQASLSRLGQEVGEAGFELVSSAARVSRQKQRNYAARFL